MRSPLSMIVLFGLTLVLSLSGRAQSREKERLPLPGENCIHVSVAVDVSVNVAVGVDGRVHLAWATGIEPDTSGFNVYRTDEEGSYIKINNNVLLPDHSGSGGESYTFVDMLRHRTTRHYLLESMRSDGRRQHRALISTSNP